MKFLPINPPREFLVGLDKNKIKLYDCAHIELNPDEQITLRSNDGSEYDVAKKSWGYYVTPSLNGRLKNFGLRAVLTKGIRDKFYILLAEKGKENEMKKYLEENEMKIVTWMDDDKTLANLENSLENKFSDKIADKNACLFCNSTNMNKIFNYDAPPKAEVKFNIDYSTYKREIVQCTTCFHFFNNHSINLENLYSKNYVDSTYGNKNGIAEHYDKIMNLPIQKSDNYHRVKKIVQFMSDKVKKQENKPSVLDIGSGLCVFLKRMKDEGWECTALDPDERAIEHARENVKINAVCTDFMKAEKLKLYDLITFNKVLEHVKDPISMLEKSKKYLKNNGVVYVEVPDGECAAKEGPEREEFSLDHYHIFSATSLNLLAVKAGFYPLLTERVQEPSTKYTLRTFLVRKEDG